MSQVFLGERVPENMPQDKVPTEVFPEHATQGEFRLLTQITVDTCVGGAGRRVMGWTSAVSHRMKASAQSHAGKPRGSAGGLCPRSPEQTSERAQRCFRPAFRTAFGIRRDRLGGGRRARTGSPPSEATKPRVFCAQRAGSVGFS